MGQLRHGAWEARTGRVRRRLRWRGGGWLETRGTKREGRLSWSIRGALRSEGAGIRRQGR